MCFRGRALSSAITRKKGPDPETRQLILSPTQFVEAGEQTSGIRVLSYAIHLPLLVSITCIFISPINVLEIMHLPAAPALWFCCLCSAGFPNLRMAAPPQPSSPGCIVTLMLVFKWQVGVPMVSECRSVKFAVFFVLFLGGLLEFSAVSNHANCTILRCMRKAA